MLYFNSRALLDKINFIFLLFNISFNRPREEDIKWYFAEAYSANYKMEVVVLQRRSTTSIKHLKDPLKTLFPFILFYFLETANLGVTSEGSVPSLPIWVYMQVLNISSKVAYKETLTKVTLSVVKVEEHDFSIKLEYHCPQ